MIKRLFVACAICLAFPAAALAALQSDPVMDAIQRVVTGGVWQDEQYVRSYDGYVNCYGKIINSSSGRLDQASARALYERASATCVDSRKSGDANALARARTLLPDKSPEYRERMVMTFRRSSIVLGLEEALRAKGLEKQFEQYAEQGADF